MPAYPRLAAFATRPVPTAAAPGGRRSMLQALGAIAVAPALLASGCASTVATPPPALRRIAPEVYVLTGARGEVTRENRGRVANAGFIVGPRGVLLVDTGTSYRHGLDLLQAVRRVTDRPVLGAVVTHARQEFVFGGPALQAHGVPVRMHRAAAELMTSRCDVCLTTMRRVIGPDEMLGTVMYRPAEVFDEGYWSEAIGRRVQVLSFDGSSAPGDVVVFDEASGVLFAGGLVDHDRIPDLQDAALDEWLRALDELRRMPISVLVPGHGAPGPADAIDAVGGYLRRLRQRLTQLVTDGVALSEIPRAATLPEYAHWSEYESLHRRNASILFVRLEREILFAPEPARASPSQP